MTQTPAVIGLTRYFSEITYDDEGNREGGWSVWVQLFEDVDMQWPMDEEHFSTKKSALAWCKNHYPHVKTSYLTNETRKQVQS